MNELVNALQNVFFQVFSVANSVKEIGESKVEGLLTYIKTYTTHWFYFWRKNSKSIEFYCKN